MVSLFAGSVLSQANNQDKILLPLTIQFTIVENDNWQFGDTVPIPFSWAILFTKNLGREEWVPIDTFYTSFDGSGEFETDRLPFMVVGYGREFSSEALTNDDLDLSMPTDTIHLVLPLILGKMQVEPIRFPVAGFEDLREVDEWIVKLKSVAAAQTIVLDTMIRDLIEYFAPSDKDRFVRYYSRQLSDHGDLLGRLYFQIEVLERLQKKLILNEK